MPNTLLTTKLYIPPPRPELVSRPRLIGRLNAALDRKLTLVSAPAGFGKTTLVSEWAAGCGRPVAWVSLDEGDNDPARFLAYSVAALQTIQESIGQGALSALRSSQPPQTELILMALINQVAALPDKIVLVLDDYHVISNRTIHDGLAFLLKHQPQQLHLVLATRADPPLPIARLRGRGQLTELRADDLRFRSAETVSLLNEVIGLDLLPEDVEALEARTEGWIVGLHLAALSLQGRADVREFITAFAGSHHYVLEYLTEEVLSRQSEGVRQFLLQTSILDRLCGPVCDAVTARDDGDALLAYLRRSNLFVIPLDDEHYWHRYHHLFADLLGNYLRKESPPERVSELHRRASRWHEENGLADAAVKYAMRGEDFERAAHLIEQNLSTRTTDLQVTAQMNWVQRLPDDVVSSRPRLCALRAWSSFFSGHMDGVEPWLQAAERLVRQDDSVATAPVLSEAEKQYVRGNVATLRAFVADRDGNAPQAIAQARMADELLPKDDVVTRSIIPYILGRAYRTEGDLMRAGQACAEMVRIGRMAGNILTVAMGLCELALLRKIQGQLRGAADLYQEALQLAAGRGDSPLPLVSIVDVGLSDLLRERNDLEAARQSAQRAVDSLEHTGLWGMPTDLVLAYTTLARVLQARGDIEGAFDVLQRAEQAKRKYNVFPEFGSIVDTCRVRMWLAQQNLADAVRWADDSQPGKRGPLLTREREQMALARVRIAQGQACPSEGHLAQALLLLDQLAKAAEDGGRGGRLIEILVIQAVALHALNNTDRALAALERGLALAGPEGYIRVFIDEGEPIAALLHAAVSRGTALEYASSLLAALAEETIDDRRLSERSIPPSDLRPTPPATGEAEGLFEPLTRRELEVLELICKGYSNQRIAETLVVTLSTVKKHTGNIYGKLGVRSRTQAIARSQELGLLPRE